MGDPGGGELQAVGGLRDGAGADRPQPAQHRKSPDWSPGLFEVRTPADRAAPFEGTAAPPPVVATRVDTGREDWSARVCFVQGGACAESVAFAVGSAELAAFSPQVWVAGEVGSSVDLTWEVWDRDQGWRQEGTPVAAAVTDPAIDPAAAAGATTTAVSLPFDDRAGQAVLYAVRTYTRASDGVELTVRSNPLLVTLYEVGA